MCKCLIFVLIKALPCYFKQIIQFTLVCSICLICDLLCIIFRIIFSLVFPCLLCVLYMYSSRGPPRVFFALTTFYFLLSKLSILSYLNKIIEMYAKKNIISIYKLLYVPKKVMYNFFYIFFKTVRNVKYVNSVSL